jgi:hypothetical protein
MKRAEAPKSQAPSEPVRARPSESPRVTQPTPPPMEAPKIADEEPRRRKPIHVPIGIR